MRSLSLGWRVDGEGWMLDEGWGGAVLGGGGSNCSTPTPPATLSHPYDPLPITLTPSLSFLPLPLRAMQGVLWRVDVAQDGLLLLSRSFPVVPPTPTPRLSPPSPPGPPTNTQGVLWRALWRVHVRRFGLTAAIKVVHDLLMFLQPYILELLLHHLSTGTRDRYACLCVCVCCVDPPSWLLCSTACSIGTTVVCVCVWPGGGGGLSCTTSAQAREAGVCVRVLVDTLAFVLQLALCCLTGLQ